MTAIDHSFLDHETEKLESYNAYDFLSVWVLKNVDYNQRFDHGYGGPIVYFNSWV